MSNNTVEFIINKMKKSDDEFWSEYSNKGYHYGCVKRNVKKSVDEYIKKEINLFKKKMELNLLNCHKINFLNKKLMKIWLK